MAARKPTPEHGTTARYLRGCRCMPCIRRRRHYNKQSRVRRELGFRGIVPAQPVAEHIAALRATGASLQAIAAAAGCSQATVLRIEHGAQALFASTAAAILAVAVPPPPLKVPAIGAARRVQALFAAGYPLAVIAQRTGLAGTHLSGIANGHKPVIARSTHDAVCAAYDVLSGKPGPSAYSRAWAARRGWAPPLAWDESAIDNPDAEPSGPASGAKLSVAAAYVAIAEDALFVLATSGPGVQHVDVAARLGVGERRLERALAYVRTVGQVGGAA
jgi:hypothetical protein